MCGYKDSRLVWGVNPEVFMLTADSGAGILSDAITCILHIISIRSNRHQWVDCNSHIRNIHRLRRSLLRRRSVDLLSSSSPFAVVSIIFRRDVMVPLLFTSFAWMLTISSLL